MNKKLVGLFIIISLYCFASAIFMNYEELWLQANDLTVSTIGIVLSIATVLACLTIFIFSNYIKGKEIKNFLCSLLFVKSILIFILFFLNQSDLYFWIKLLIMIDYIINIEIMASVYPLISYITIDDKVFALKEIFIEVASNIGIIISSLLLGKYIFNNLVDYNTYFFIGGILTFVSYMCLKNLNINIKETKDNGNSMKTVVSKIKNNKQLMNYCFYRFFNNLAYFLIIGISLLLLINALNYSVDFVSKWRIISVLISALIGFVFIKYINVKNDYIAVFIKLGIRLLLYILVILYTKPIIALIAITYTLLSCLLFPDIVDGKYINKFKSSEQLAFSNLNEIISRLGRALGIYLCSLCIDYSYKIVFFLGAIFAIIQIYFICKTISYNKGK